MGGSPARREWVGGRFLAPAHVGEEDPYRPVLELWLALPEHHIVHFEVHDPNVPIPSVTHALKQKLLEPPTGVSPGRLRLNDPDWVTEVRRTLPKLTVLAAPTPELDLVFDDMMSSMAGPTTYLPGTLSAEAMGRLFAAADALYRLGPWEFASDDQLIEVNIPELDVHGGCLSIIGALGESYGLLLFASLADYERMVTASTELDQTGNIQEIGCDITSLNYERGADLPAAMRREVRQYGWPVAAAGAYPVVDHRGRDDLARDATPRELHIITACTEALVAMFEQRRDMFEAPELPVLSLTHVDREGVEVHLAAPPSGWMANDDDAGPHMELHRLDHAVMARLLHYADERWGERFIRRIDRLIRTDDEAQLMFHVGAYHLTAEDGKTLAECFLEDHGGMLNAPERRWLAAQQVAWLSLWEVTAVTPDSSLELHDLLTGEVRQVQDQAASESVVQRGILLARVVHFDDVNLLLGSHPQVLAPLAGADVAERMHKYLRRQSAIAPERLRDAKTVRYLIRCWREKHDEVRQTVALRPELRNTDGELILGTVDRYTFKASHRPRVEAGLLGLEGLGPDGSGRFTFLRERKGRRTVIGWVRLQDDTLRVESNSVERADALRERVERACAGVITHRGRIHEDPLMVLDRGVPVPEPPSDIPPGQLDVLVQTYKRQHYEDWLDEPVPALGNQTPRQAARSKKGRARVAALINEFEYAEASLPAGQRFDVSVLRRKLQL